MNRTKYFICNAIGIVMILLSLIIFIIAPLILGYKFVGQYYTVYGTIYSTDKNKSNTMNVTYEYKLSDGDRLYYSQNYNDNSSDIPTIRVFNISKTNGEVIHPVPYKIYYYFLDCIIFALGLHIFSIALFFKKPSENNNVIVPITNNQIVFTDRQYGFVNQIKPEMFNGNYNKQTAQYNNSYNRNVSVNNAQTQKPLYTESFNNNQSNILNNNSVEANNYKFVGIDIENKSVENIVIEDTNKESELSNEVISNNTGIMSSAIDSIEKEVFNITENQNINTESYFDTDNEYEDLFNENNDVENMSESIDNNIESITYTNFDTEPIKNNDVLEFDENEGIENVSESITDANFDTEPINNNDVLEFDENEGIENEQIGVSEDNAYADIDTSDNLCYINDEAKQVDQSDLENSDNIETEFVEELVSKMDISSENNTKDAELKTVDFMSFFG